MVVQNIIDTISNYMHPAHQSSTFCVLFTNEIPLINIGSISNLDN